jgi:hypothetical protein
MTSIFRNNISIYQGMCKLFPLKKGIVKEERITIKINKLTIKNLDTTIL